MVILIAVEIKYCGETQLIKVELKQRAVLVR